MGPRKFCGSYLSREDGSFGMKEFRSQLKCMITYTLNPNPQTLNPEVPAQHDKFVQLRMTLDSDMRPMDQGFTGV